MSRALWPQCLMLAALLGLAAALCELVVLPAKRTGTLGHD